MARARSTLVAFRVTEVVAADHLTNSRNSVRNWPLARRLSKAFGKSSTTKTIHNSWLQYVGRPSMATASPRSRWISVFRTLLLHYSPDERRARKAPQLEAEPRSIRPRVLWS